MPTTDVGMIGVVFLGILLALSVFRKNIFVYLAIFVTCWAFFLDPALNSWLKAGAAVLSFYPIGGILMLLVSDR